MLSFGTAGSQGLALEILKTWKVFLMLRFVAAFSQERLHLYRKILDSSEVKASRGP
jgi:hypothetical protein